MSIYDTANVGPYVRFVPDFSGGSDSVTVSVEYYEATHPDGEWEWEKAWDPNGGYANFCIPLRTWEAFQHYARSVHG